MDDVEDKDMEIVKKHAEQLGEMFDSVQIFVTRHEAGEHDGTINAHYGAGNYFTRYGQIRNWVNRQDAIDADQAKRNARDD